MKPNISTAGLLALGTLAQSQAQEISKHCLSSDVCYALSIPEQTARTGDGDIFMQFSAPTSFSWIALGQGSGMAGSNMFVVYSNGKGNVTVSPRLGTGHVEPAHDNAANITLLEGSGVANGQMVANVRCENCRSWSGGSMDFTSDSAGWIAASKSGNPLNSPDPNETIQQHDDSAPFSWDLVAAKGGDIENPFFTSSGADSSGSAGSTNSSTGTSEGSDSDENADDNKLPRLHGLLASIAFVILFPIGGIMIRVGKMRGLVWTHAAIQVLSYLLFIAATGIGIHVAMTGPGLTNQHPITGLLLFAVLFFQPISGLLHHNMFKKKGGRTGHSYVHIWIGRGAIVLGLINGGLGFQFASEGDNTYIIAYGVLAAVFGVAFLASTVSGKKYRPRRERFTQNEQKERERSEEIALMTMTT